MTAGEAHPAELHRTFVEAERIYRRLGWVLKLRPQPVGVFAAAVLGGSDRKRLVELPNGIAFHLDPLTQFAWWWFEGGGYERETEDIFRAEIGPDDIVVDVGANEGYFTVLAAQLAHRGRVIAVEPQARCIDALSQNLAANRIGNCTILPVALGQSPGMGELHLMPEVNTGASSLVRPYRWAKHKQAVEIIDASTLAARAGIEQFDFMKVDVEGYEPEVVGGLLPMLRAGRVKKLLLDYHPVLLAERAIKLEDIHEQIIACGLHGALNKDGYTLYSMAR
jgi:FkbM family methyltransferase